jgi:hypothetical protein
MARKDLQPYPVNVTLAITKEDIDFGIAQDSASCAIACAIYRTYPDALRVRVNRKTISWSDAATDVRYVYPTPPRADANIIRPFDLGLKDQVRAQRFTLTGGQFRDIDHHAGRRKTERERARDRKRTDPEGYLNAHRPKGYNNPGSGRGRGNSRIYERYVPRAEDL